MDEGQTVRAHIQRNGDSPAYAFEQSKSSSKLGEKATDGQEMIEPIWARPMFDHLLSEENSALTENVWDQEGVPLPPPPDELEEWNAQAIIAQKEALRVVRVPPPLSLDAQAEDRDEWRIVESSFANKSKLKARVTGWNKGGLLVSLGSLRGFVPASHLIYFPRHLPVSEREHFLAEQVGKELELSVIELDRQKSRLVLSERACLWNRGEGGDNLLDTLKSGDIVEGVVSNLCDFGAFVDLGHVDGLVHISEISWQRINHPQEVLKIGQRVRVRVLSVDREQRRIALSLKRGRVDPWEGIEERYHVGQIVRGVVTHVAGFGAFVRVEDGLEGLVHSSELAEGGFSSPGDVVHKGQEVQVCILSIDGQRRRLGLSLRQARVGNREKEGGPRLAS